MERFATPPLPDDDNELVVPAAIDKLTEMVAEMRDSLLAMSYQLQTQQQHILQLENSNRTTTGPLPATTKLLQPPPTECVPSDSACSKQ